MEKDETTPPEEKNLEVPSDDGHSDPLDEVFDEDSLRDQAKKFRSIAQRKSKELEEAKVEPKEPPQEPPKEEPKEAEGDYLKKSDFELANQKKAILLATTPSESDSEEVKSAKKDMSDNWEQVKLLYVSRRGKDTPEEILEDIKDAYTVFNARREKKEEKGDIKGLSETKIIPGGTTPPSSKTPPKSPPNFKLPTPPTEWYQKPQ